MGSGSCGVLATEHGCSLVQLRACLRPDEAVKETRVPLSDHLSSGILAAAEATAAVVSLAMARGEGGSRMSFWDRTQLPKAKAGWVTGCQSKPDASDTERTSRRQHADVLPPVHR